MTYFTQDDFIDKYGEDLDGLFCGNKLLYDRVNSHISHLIGYNPCGCGNCLSCCQKDEIKSIAMTIFYDEAITNETSKMWHLLNKYVAI